MLNEREVRSRERMAAESSVPFTNYGILIAYMNGILKRSLQPFPELAELAGKLWGTDDGSGDSRIPVKATQTETI